MPIPAELAAAVPIAVGPTANDAERELSSVLSEFVSTMLTDFPIQGILEHLVQRIVDVLPISGAGVNLDLLGVRPPLRGCFRCFCAALRGVADRAQ